LTPERWREITAAFHAARASAPDDRSAVLNDVCRGDAALRHEVEALLDADCDAFTTGVTPARLDDLPQLSPGASFGPYRVDGFIGAGGMGQVYRATDTRLGRTVALKVLLTNIALDPGITARFEREAQLLAALNHPNIAGIHGVETVDGVQALVLEFVDGPPLAARCPMPMSDALSVAQQIASALEAAHARGIVHRDLKPGNVKIGVGNRVKVLDFGIAHASREVARAATTVQHPTGPGVVIGTPAYMSPEQARGLPIDSRTDIWAFGCVLFEMLTGRGAFAGDTASDSMARAIEREPDWSRLPADTPPAIARLLRRCLRKDPDERLHHIADARIEIADALADPARVETPMASTPRAVWIYKTAWSIVAGLVVIVGAKLWWGGGSSTATTPAGQAMEFGVTFPNNFLPTVGLSISPDGRQIAAGVWSDGGSIWMHTFDGSPPHPLNSGEGGGPFWSPDSSILAFFQISQLVTLKASGGSLTRIANVSQDNNGGTWSRQGVILYSDGGRLYQVAAAGGGTPVEVPLTGVPGRRVWPHFLPDGRHFLFCAEGLPSGSLDIASLDGGPVTVLGDSECPGGFAPPDHVLYVRSGSLIAQRLDLKRLALAGEAVVIASDVTRGAAGPWPLLTVSASDTGVLAFPSSRSGSFGHLTWFSRDGKALGAIEPPNDGAEYLNPAISPDGRLVAANLIEPATGVWHIWLIDGARGNAASRLTTDTASDFDPVWSNDGSEIVYTSDRGGHVAFYRQSISGGTAVMVRDASHELSPIASDWSPGGHLLFQLLQRSIWDFRMADRATRRVGPENTHVYGARFSPDGKWLAYAQESPSHFDIFVERFPGGSPRRQVSTGPGGVHPRWTTTHGGLELVYWAPPGGILSTELSLSDQGIRVGATRTLVDLPVLTLADVRPHYDVTRDGQRLLVRQPARPQGPGIRVIVNWMARLPH